MGGFGSGRWNRWGSKTTTDSYRRLDIQILAKKGSVLPYGVKSGSWHWWSENESLGSIDYHSNTSSKSPYFQVMYLLGQSGETMDYKILLTKTQPHYGGIRWWFKCPAQGCGRRVRILYLNKIFACRTCLNLTYESQNEMAHDRLQRKAQKINHSLGGDGEMYARRPKGMHRTTYRRKLEAMIHYSDLSDEMFEQRILLLDTRIMKRWG